MRELIIVRGGGDLATGTVHRLWQAGFRVLVLETASPAAIRRQVSVCEAVFEGQVTVEGLTARLVSAPAELDAVWAAGEVPVLVDPLGRCLEVLQPSVVVDAILAKKNLGTHRAMAPLTIALGPGFEAGRDVDVVIETVRGPLLGSVITRGFALPNSGIPGDVCGCRMERVIYSDAAGEIRWRRSVGQAVTRGEVIATVGGQPVCATMTGILRGAIREGYQITRGFKIADIDPRLHQPELCWQISDKSRCIADAVLGQVTGFLQK